MERKVDQVRDWVPKTIVVKSGERICKGPGMPCASIENRL
jgi:hypothetical protein